MMPTEYPQAFLKDLFSLREAASQTKVDKDSRVSFGKTRYSYTSISSIIGPLSTLMREHGFIHYWTGDDAGDATRIVLSVCLVHRSGASIRSTMSSPLMQALAVPRSECWLHHHLPAALPPVVSPRHGCWPGH